MDPAAAPASQPEGPADPSSGADGEATTAVPGGEPTAGGSSGVLGLIIVALGGAVAADAAGIGGDPGSRGWAWPGAFALLGAAGSAAVLALSFALARIRERRRG